MAVWTIRTDKENADNYKVGTAACPQGRPAGPACDADGKAMSKASELKVLFGWRAKLHNRRVLVHGLANGEVGITWVKLENGIPIETKVRLSRDAAMATAKLIIVVLSNAEGESRAVARTLHPLVGHSESGAE